MNRVVAVTVVLLVVAGSVPAAGALADTAQVGSDAEGDQPAPGATFAGVVGVQEAEIDNEVAQRSLDQQFAAAGSNRSKARVVADQQQRLSQRVDELEAEKQRVERAYENGNMSHGEYNARLAKLGAELRAVERRANQTAEAAVSLPEEALREGGADVSEVREVAQRANRTGGGAVAEAAREIAGEGVGNGLRGPPEEGDRGPPDDAGPPDDREGEENETESDDGDGEADRPGNGPPDRSPGGPVNGSDRGNGEGDAAGNATETPENETENDRGNGTDGDRGNGENGADGDRGNSSASDGDRGNDTESGDGQPTDAPGNGDSANGGDGANNGTETEDDTETENTATETETPERTDA